MATFNNPDLNGIVKKWEYYDTLNEEDKISLVKNTTKFYQDILTIRSEPITQPYDSDSHREFGLNEQKGIVAEMSKTNFSHLEKDLEKSPKLITAFSPLALIMLQVDNRTLVRSTESIFFDCIKGGKGILCIHNNIELPGDFRFFIDSHSVEAKKIAGERECRPLNAFSEDAQKLLNKFQLDPNNKHHVNYWHNKVSSLSLSKGKSVRIEHSPYNGTDNRGKLKFRSNVVKVQHTIAKCLNGIKQLQAKANEVGYVIEKDELIKLINETLNQPSKSISHTLGVSCLFRPKEVTELKRDFQTTNEEEESTKLLPK